MDKFVKKLNTRYQKLLHQAQNVGLSLPIALLIFLTFFSIITVAVIQTRRDTTQTRASGCPYLPTSAGKQLCDSACASKGGCTTCPGGGGYTCKNDVIEPPPNTTGNTGTGGTNPNLANCKAGFYRSAGACVGACGQNNCRECLRYGAGGYYECKDLPKPSTAGNNTCPKNTKTFYYESDCVKPENCASGGCSRCYDNNNPRWYCVSNDKPLCSKGQTCKDYFPNTNLTNPNKPIFWPKSEGVGTYETLADCESQKNAKDANIICGNSATTTSTICSTMKPGNPYVLSNNRCYWCNNSKDPAPYQVDITNCTQTNIDNTDQNKLCQSTSCEDENKNFKPELIQQKTIYKSNGQLFSDSDCKIPLDFQKNCISNTPLITEKRLCINTNCGMSFKDLPNVDYNKPLERYGNEYYLPGCETKLANPRNYCIKGGAIIGPQKFVYPQTTVLQQTITSPVVTVEGETIYCNQLTCIVL